VASGPIALGVLGPGRDVRAHVSRAVILLVFASLFLFEVLYCCPGRQPLRQEPRTNPACHGPVSLLPPQLRKCTRGLS